MPNPPKRVIDTQLHRMFPALNQCYLSLYREGYLTQMQRAGRLAPIPEQDNFGYYKIRKFYPGRFVQEDEQGWQAAHQLII